MAHKITTAVFALIMGFSFNSFAGTPETKGEAKMKADAISIENPNDVANPTELKWFRYNGEPGDEDDATLYSVITSPSCPTSGTHVCEIQTQPQASNANLPDLNVTPSETRMKN
ncbi:hypothetical protein [Sphingobacterium sp.]|uniref:hypothetical protein n=1 Tax=Sphingobacterium sp. TaxID=341027 RepID=UPI00289CA733|nr:hypothetical protein [Sphingobacterium sp.]